jgi:Ca-activated chloride channel family protein
MAQKDLQAGDVHKATTRLKNLATQLLSSGESELAQTVMLELDSLHATKALSEDAKKRIKYGTRALVLEPSIEEREP